MDTFLIIVSIALVFFVIIDAIAAFLLTKSVRQSKHRYPALNERTLVAQTSFGAGVILAGLGMNRIFGWGWDNDLALMLLVLALLVKSTPGLIWLSFWAFGKFRPKDPDPLGE